ncbi:MAG: hypothetical protein ABII12_04195 [Planctomycetota bacterium]
MSELDEEFDWPDKGQRISRFKGPQDRKAERTDTPARPRSAAFNAMVNQHRDDLHREAWFWAGHNLARDIVQQGELKKWDPTREFRGLLLPMLYCYRHYLELALKHLIEELGSLSRFHSTLDLTKTHRLMQLWNAAKGLASNLFDDDENDKNVERLLNEFHQFDPSSQTFRYRRDKHGRPHDDSIPSPDLLELIRVMKGLRNYFEHWKDRVWEYRQGIEDVGEY